MHQRLSMHVEYKKGMQIKLSGEEKDNIGFFTFQRGHTSAD